MNAPLVLVRRFASQRTAPNILRRFQTRSAEELSRETASRRIKPGSLAFADCETNAIADLFYHFAKVDGGVDGRGHYLCYNGVKELLYSIGERPHDTILLQLFQDADKDNDGKLHLEVRTFLPFE